LSTVSYIVHPYVSTYKCPEADSRSDIDINSRSTREHLELQGIGPRLPLSLILQCLSYGLLIAINELGNMRWIFIYSESQVKLSLASVLLNYNLCIAPSFPRRPLDTRPFCIILSSIHVGDVLF
jgi:hypothetical protein